MKLNRKTQLLHLILLTQKLKQYKYDTSNNCMIQMIQLRYRHLRYKLIQFILLEEINFLRCINPGIFLICFLRFYIKIGIIYLMQLMGFEPRNSGIPRMRTLCQLTDHDCQRYEQLLLIVLSMNSLEILSHRIFCDDLSEELHLLNKVYQAAQFLQLYLPDDKKQHFESLFRVFVELQPCSDSKLAKNCQMPRPH